MKPYEKAFQRIQDRIPEEQPLLDQSDQHLFNSGWNAALDYMQDRHRLQTQKNGNVFIALSMASMAVAFLLFMLWGAASYFYGSFTDPTILGAVALASLSLFLGRRGIRMNENHEAEFQNKWG